MRARPPGTHFYECAKSTQGERDWNESVMSRRGRFKDPSSSKASARGKVAGQTKTMLLSTGAAYRQEETRSRGAGGWLIPIAGPAMWICLAFDLYSCRSPAFRGLFGNGYILFISVPSRVRSHSAATHAATPQHKCDKQNDSNDRKNALPVHKSFPS